MSEAADLEFTGEVVEWRGPAPFHFVVVPPDQAQWLQDISQDVTYGWGMIPVMQLSEIDTDLVPITAAPDVDVPLYWQHWKLASERLSRLTSALTRAAEQMR